MDRNRAIHKLSKGALISLAHAEDLYDTVVPRPVIPYYIADYIEKVKSEGDYTVVGAVNEAPDGRVRDWLFSERVNTFAQAWINGYIVEGEPKYPKYTVRIKGLKASQSYLNCNASRSLAHQLDLDVTECLGIAYEEIKNRKGKMINGTFVKEEDL